MSKIEIECKSCQSILRVDERHGGKQARCPNCGGFTLIPGGEAKAVPAPDSTSMPFDEPYYQDQHNVGSVDETQYADSWSRDPYPPLEDEWDRRTAPYHGTSGSDRDSRTPRRDLEIINEYNTSEPAAYYPTNYQPAAPQTAPLYDQPSNQGSIIGGFFSLLLLFVSFLSLPVCFCITPFTLAAAKGLTNSSPEGLRGLINVGFWLLMVLWIFRIVAFLIVMA